MISQTLLEITRANSSCFLAYIYDINRRRKIRATRAVAQSTTRWTLVQPVGAMHRWMLPSTGIPARPPLPARLTPRNSLRTHSMPARTAFMCRTQSAMCVLPRKRKCPRLFVSWEAAVPSGMDAALRARSLSSLICPLVPCSYRMSNGHTEWLHRSASAATGSTLWARRFYVT